MTVGINSIRTLGLWSAVLYTIFSLTYIVAQFSEWAGSAHEH
jgi:hypothetical protein